MSHAAQAAARSSKCIGSALLALGLIELEARHDHSNQCCDREPPPVQLRFARSSVTVAPQPVSPWRASALMLFN
jgi:hypothetical protein